MATLTPSLATYGVELVRVERTSSTGPEAPTLLLTMSTLPARRHIRALELALAAKDPEAVEAAIEAMPPGLRKLATAHVEQLAARPGEGE